MSKFLGRLIAYVLIGSFCIAGPLLLVIALCTAANRATLLYSGVHAEATVVAKRASGSGRKATYAPVFQFTARDGQSYTVTSDVSGPEATYRYTQRIAVLYPAADPQSARIDTFSSLWTLSLVAGVVGASFSVVPAFVVITWLRRRRLAAGLAPPDSDAIASGEAPIWVRRALGVLLLAGGLALLASAAGLFRQGIASPRESQVLSTCLGIILSCAGVLTGRWVRVGTRLNNALAGMMITSMAALFGWIAIYGDASGFSSGIGAGGAFIATGGHVTAARIAFGFGSVVFGLMSLLAWKQAFQRRD